MSVIRFIKEAGEKLFGHGRSAAQKLPVESAAGNARDSGKVAQMDRQSAIRDKYYGDSDDGVLSKQEAWLHSP